MQNKKTWLWIVLGIAGAVVLLVFLFMSGKKKVNWEEHYTTNSKDPYGLYLLKELIADTYKDNMKDITKSVDETLSENDTGTGNNIIFIGNNLNLNDRDQKAFYTFIEKGNTAFVSVNNLPYSIQYLVQTGGTFTFDSATQSIVYPDQAYVAPVQETDAIEEVFDSISIYTDEGDSIPAAPYEETELYTAADTTSYDTSYATAEEISTLTPVSFAQAKIYTKLKAPLPDTQKIFIFETAKTAYFNIDLPYKWNFVSAHAQLHESCSRLATVNDSMYNFISIPYGKGKLYIHTSPILFSNFHLKEKEGFAYVKDILSVLSNGTVYWNEIPLSQGSSDHGGINTPKAYLKYILSFDSLRWAWYVLLATTLIYIVFTSKRKQRIIPVIEPVANTSLEYVHTTGRLYAQIGNHRKVIQLNMRLFLSGIQQKYGVHVNLSDQASCEWLANKSAIPVDYFTELNNLYQKLTLPGNDIKTTDLHTFYKQMQFIYKKIQN